MHLQSGPYTSPKIQALPTKADENSVKPMARGAREPWPGLVTAVAYTTDTCAQALGLRCFQPPVLCQHA